VIGRGTPAIWSLKSLRLSDPAASGSLGVTITSLVVKAKAFRSVGDVTSVGTATVAYWEVPLPVTVALTLPPGASSGLGTSEKLLPLGAAAPMNLVASVPAGSPL